MDPWVVNGPVTTAVYVSRCAVYDDPVVEDCFDEEVMLLKVSDGDDTIRMDDEV
jgi:hypothetical protein